MEATVDNIPQIFAQTTGVIPKNDLKRLKFVFGLEVAFVYKLPSLKNVSDDISLIKSLQF